MAFRQTYLNARFTIEDQVAEGDKVASRLIATARRSADGQEVVLYGLNISLIANRRIIEEWMAWEVQTREAEHGMAVADRGAAMATAHHGADRRSSISRRLRSTVRYGPERCTPTALP